MFNAGNKTVVLNYDKLVTNWNQLCLKDSVHQTAENHCNAQLPKGVLHDVRYDITTLDYFFQKERPHKGASFVNNVYAKIFNKLYFTCH